MMATIMIVTSSWWWFLVVSTALSTISTTPACRLSEYFCDNGRCIPLNRYCDNIDDCGDSSDEPRYCTRCNRTYYGDVGKTYSIELHRPKEDRLPFICHLTFKAGGNDLGDIVQAYDTTAISLSFVLLQLAARKTIQNEVHEEILGVLKETNSDSINFDDLPKLKYMEMVIKESMRLNATGPMIGRELSKDIKIGDLVIPKGANVIIPIVALHRNNAYWKNPMKFDPYRFTTENINSRHPFTYIPFSAGPRNCIGIRYAWILMKLTLDTLLTRYEFHTDLNLNDLKYEFAATMKLVNGFQVRITQRPKTNE